MKKIINLVLVLALAATIALGDDGHTGGGNRCETCTPPPCTQNCPGFAEEEETTTLGESELDNDISYTEYFTKIFWGLVG